MSDQQTQHICETLLLAFFIGLTLYGCESADKRKHEMELKKLELQIKDSK